MLSRYAGPQEGSYSIHLRQMATRKPWNVNDEELFDGMQNIDRPLSQPTEMSYFLQRIRLGEMCRELIDRMPLGARVVDWEAHADVIAVDAHFIKFLDDMPAFFKLNDSDKVGSNAAQPGRQVLTTGIVVQRYILHSLVHSHRCKMHLPYLAKASSNTQFAYSREACLEAARQTVRTERLLEREAVQFVHTRFRISGVLQAVFIACIAFLLDMCFHNDRGQCDPKRKAELLEACSILEEARNHSPMTANLLESLNNIVQKYKLTLPRFNSLTAGAFAPSHNPLPTTEKMTEKTTAPGHLDNRVTGSLFLDLTPQAANTDMESLDWDTFNTIDLEGLDWNALLNELDSQLLANSFSSV